MTDAPPITAAEEGLKAHHSLWYDVWAQFRTHRGAMADFRMRETVLRRARYSGRRVASRAPCPHSALFWVSMSKLLSAGKFLQSGEYYSRMCP